MSLSIRKAFCCLLVSLLISIPFHLLYAQKTYPGVDRSILEQKTKPSLMPGGMLDQVFDRFGNRLELVDILAPDQLQLKPGGGHTCASVAASCSSGYFRMYLEPGKLYHEHCPCRPPECAMQGVERYF